MPVKLSKRLNALYQHIPEGYSHIWDCCCDHGLLGMALLESRAQTQIHFVDQVPEITARLAHLLPPHNRAHYQVHTLNAADIELMPGTQHLLIMAGIGGETALELIRAIETRHPAEERHYLLSPNYQLFTLRNFLQQQGFSLLAETLVTENKRHNEILLVSNQHTYRPISACGDFWNNTPEHSDYCARLIQHYQHKKMHAISEAYQQIAKQLGI